MVLLILGLLFQPSIARPVNDDKALNFLQQFGYIHPGGFSLSSDGEPEDPEEMLKDAIRKYQNYAGLRETGILDLETKERMAAPRCGMDDFAALSSDHAMSLFSWKKSRLTYSIDAFSSDLSQAEIKRAIRNAYNTWSSVTNLEIVEVPPGSNADIHIRFATGDHGDFNPFDGQGGVLAHASYPPNGQFHIDDDEKWIYGDSRYSKDLKTKKLTDLFFTALHEGGHSLGLMHSRDPSAIMYAEYRPNFDASGNYIQPRLTNDDIQAIQATYGAKNNTSGKIVRTTTKSYQKPITTTTTARPPTSSTGKDRHQNCVIWAKYGHCSSNPIWMRNNCQLSCNECKRNNNCSVRRPVTKWTTRAPSRALTTTSKPKEKPRPAVQQHGQTRRPSITTVRPPTNLGGTDKNQNCMLWAKYGQCRTNPIWMAKNCQLACKKCKDKRNC